MPGGRILEALCPGACGYLLKKTPPARLIEALRDAVDGGAPMSPEVTRRVVDLFRELVNGIIGILRVFLPAVQ